MMPAERQCFECFEATGFTGREVDPVSPRNVYVLVLIKLPSSEDEL